ncbi:MAG TPA: beta-1,3-glucanase family protein [Streptosporangiaceae bacterium]|nr:beta-1,3-glucanase family protein [Streptosporangiaceae bacterium]
MNSRRGFIGTSLAAAGALSLPALASAQDRRGARSTPANLAIDLVNNTGSDSVHAYVTGLAIDHGNALILLRADGRTPYYPSSPPSPLSPVGADIAIPLHAPGAAPKRITVPHLAGARLWFSVGSKLTFYLDPGPTLVQPSVSNLSDPNIHKMWDFCEFTYDSAQIFANISAVDFVCLPVGLHLTDTSGGHQTVHGLPAGGVDKVCSGLAAQALRDGHGWDKLVYTAGGKHLRALSPYNGMVIDQSLFSGYLSGISTRTRPSSQARPGGRQGVRV